MVARRLKKISLPAMMAFIVLFVVSALFSGFILHDEMAGMGDSDINKDCPFSLNSGLCAVSLTAHLKEWEDSFAAVFKIFNTFLVAGVAVLIVRLNKPDQFGPPAFLISKEDTTIGKPLTDLYRRGILNSKAY